MSARSAWSAVLRIFLSCLLLGILYQTWVLRGQHSTQATLEDLRSSIAQRLEQLSAGYDQQAFFDNHLLDLGPSVGFANYTALLEKATQDAFSLPSSPLPSQLQQAITSARSAAQLAPKDGWPLLEMPHTITTSLKDISDMPPEFKGWERSNPGWSTEIYDDETQDRWMREHLAATTDSGSEKTAVLTTYEGLPRPVLKSDMFRYLKVFLDGGVYADSDTSGVVPVSEWGTKAGTLQDWTDLTLLRLNAEALIHTHGDSPSPPINEAPPALIVALETGTRRDDHEGGHLAQYGFAAAPGHPVFLDLLQHIVEVSRAVEQLRAAGDNRTWNTDRIVYTWTGPEIWSSAVWRYLWARWGFDSRRLHRTSHPIRVGDVLILPYMSFQAPAPEPIDGQPAEACLWHAFSGFTRWKHPKEGTKKIG